MKKREKSKRKTPKPSGYWKDFENLKRELTHVIEREYRDDKGNVIKFKGEFPTFPQLSRIGRDDLAMGIAKYHGGLNAVRTRLGYELSRKPPGYWQDTENIKRHLKDAIEKDWFDERSVRIKPKGEFPTHSQLKRIGLTGLSYWIGKYSDGMQAVRQKMGYAPNAARSSRWRNFKDVKRKLTHVIQHEYRDDQGSIIKPKGKFPTHTQLSRIGLTGLSHWIMKHGGGMNALKQRMGYDANTTPPGYWKDFESVKRELAHIIEHQYRDENGNLIKEKGEFPTSTVLKRIGCSGLLTAMETYHGGMYSARCALGHRPKRKPSGYWANPENMTKELQQVINNEYRDEKGDVVKVAGEFPTRDVLDKIGRADLSSAIDKRYGGIGTIRKQMGFQASRKRAGYWQNPANLRKELTDVIAGEYLDREGNVVKARGEFPSHDQFKLIDRQGLLNAICRYHDGLRAARTMMGHEQIRKLTKHLQTPDNMIKELKNIIKNEYFDVEGRLIKPRGQFPTCQQLQQIGWYALGRAIQVYHGGINSVREKLGYPPLVKPSRYWKDFENIRRGLERIIERIGKFPSESEVERMGITGLLSAITKQWDGIVAVKERMGYGRRVPHERVREFIEKAETIEGARELLGCPDLTMADKADILIARSTETFRSREYTEWVMSTMFDMTSLKPYLRQDEPPRRHFDPYNFGRHDLDDVMDRYPHFLETPSTYELVLRKLENIYFKKMRQDRARALADLRRKKKREGILGQLYDQVHKNCKEIFALRIPGTVTRIKNPYKVKERKLLEDGTVEWIHSGKESEYVEFPALHQKRGILHIARHKRILIADEMGTGKTAQAVLAKLYLEHKSGQRLKTLIICPNSIKELWIEKIDEYCKNISRKEIVVLAGHRDKETALKHAKEDVDFVITNYALLSRSPDVGQFNLVDELTKMAFDYVIVDEVHNAKNMDANRAISVSKITKDVEYLVLLSGTPIPNRLKDMGMTMHILDPQRFPNPIAFNRLYSKNPRILRDLLLSGRMLRVRANEVIQLPALKSRKITVNPTAPQREAYIRVFLDKKLNSYSKLAKLRRILIDPNIIPAYLDVSRAQSGKLKKLDGIIHEKATQGEKTVVYTNFKYRVTDMLARRYAKYGVCVIDGDVPARTRMNDDSDREKIRKEFQTGDKRVLIATIGTLCEGVDLTAARTVIFLDPPFTSTAMDQSTSRVHRLGQSRPVEVYNLIASDREIADVTRHPETGQSGTIDEAMYDLVEKKERIIDHVIDGARLSKDELKLLEKNSDASQLLKSIAYAISPS